MNQLRVWLAYYILPKDTRKYLIKALSDNIKKLEKETAKLYDKMNADFYTHAEPLTNKEKPLWLGKNCKDCGNEKCKKLGTLPRGYDCALWQAENESKEKKV